MLVSFVFMIVFVCGVVVVMVWFVLCDIVCVEVVMEVEYDCFEVLLVNMLLVSIVEWFKEFE